MPHFICTTCGTQHAESEQPPATCVICDDERQYVKATGQQWTTHDKLRRTNLNSIRAQADDSTFLFANDNLDMLMANPALVPLTGLYKGDETEPRDMMFRVLPAAKVPTNPTSISLWARIAQSLWAY